MLRTTLCVWLALSGVGFAQKTTDKVVKVTAKADKPAANGNQTITVTLTIDKGWHVYANPVINPDLDSVQTTVTITGVDSAKVTYPKGKTVADKIVGDYATYEGEVTITAQVARKPGSTAPIEVAVKCQACSDKACLNTTTIKTKVPSP